MAVSAHYCQLLSPLIKSTISLLFSFLWLYPDRECSRQIHKRPLNSSAPVPAVKMNTFSLIENLLSRAFAHFLPDTNVIQRTISLCQLSGCQADWHSGHFNHLGHSGKTSLQGPLFYTSWLLLSPDKARKPGACVSCTSSFT